jgi:hypothetical protein
MKENYLHIAAPDTKAVIDFAATHEAAEVTVEITLTDGELHVYIKKGPDAEILCDECYDVEHSTDRIDFGPGSDVDFSAFLVDQEAEAQQDDYRHNFEHGQWWVVSTVSGETWSVHETLEDGSPGIGFELITEAIEE